MSLDSTGMVMDTLPWRLFKKMKTQYPTKMIVITPGDLKSVGVLEAFDNPMQYVKALFMKQHNLEIVRYRHNYKTLEGTTPELGLVFMAGDSELVPAMEVWALVGHNARYAEKKDEPAG